MPDEHVKNETVTFGDAECMIQPKERWSNLTDRDNVLWLQCWRDRRTDFNQTTVNQFLTAFWPGLDLARGNRVFVYLCGKSLDMIWLAKQGHEVIGVELSPIVVRAFFRENQLQPTRQKVGKFILWQHGRVSILSGDYFSLTMADLGRIDTVHDRAALSALPEDIRWIYVAHLRLIRNGQISRRLGPSTKSTGSPPDQYLSRTEHL